jgi:hypothetical protein
MREITSSSRCLGSRSDGLRRRSRASCARQLQQHAGLLLGPDQPRKLGQELHGRDQFELQLTRACSPSTQDMRDPSYSDTFRQLQDRQRQLPGRAASTGKGA